MEERILVIDGVHKNITGLLQKDGFQVTYLKSNPNPSELSNMLADYDALVVRSYDLRPLEGNSIIPNNVLAVGRAGAGVDKIPHGEMRERGIVVFNTPGSNANSVKELVIGNLIAASRNLYDAASWTNSLTADVLKTAEKEKKRFKGSEIRGKTLGVIGLGYIGKIVAHDAASLGMHIRGYDPFLAAEKRKDLGEKVQISDVLNGVLENSDYVTLHCAYIPGKNKHMIGEEQISNMKKGSVLLNFARGELVDDGALKEYLASGHISRYVTDFPSDELVSVPNVIRIPHLGASTDEAEENCAVMIAKQFSDYFRRGEISNSVNYPSVQLDSLSRNNASRLGLLMKDRPGLISEIAGAFSKREINIEDMTYKSNEGFGYFLADSYSPVSSDVLAEVRKIEGFIRLRINDKAN